MITCCTVGRLIISFFYVLFSCKHTTSHLFPVIANYICICFTDWYNEYSCQDYMRGQNILWGIRRHFVPGHFVRADHLLWRRDQSFSRSCPAGLNVVVQYDPRTFVQGDTRSVVLYCHKGYSILYKHLATFSSNILAITLTKWKWKGSAAALLLLPNRNNIWGEANRLDNPWQRYSHQVKALSFGLPTKNVRHESILYLI